MFQSIPPPTCPLYLVCNRSAYHLVWPLPLCTSVTRPPPTSAPVKRPTPASPGHLVTPGPLSQRTDKGRGPVDQTWPLNQQCGLSPDQLCCPQPPSTAWGGPSGTRFPGSLRRISEMVPVTSLADP